jgi:hypothetical protein
MPYYVSGVFTQQLLHLFWSDSHSCYLVILCFYIS